MDAAPDGAAQRRTPRSRKPRTPLPERLVRRLAQEILDGRLTPGVRLEEQALADRFKVSRTPVREALQRLAATGLVERRPHKGVVVCSFDAPMSPTCLRPCASWKPCAPAWPPRA